MALTLAQRDALTVDTAFLGRVRQAVRQHATTLLVITGPPPSSTVNLGLLGRSWPAPWYPAQARGPVAPLTLTYGQQPAPQPQPSAILASWIPPWRSPPLPVQVAAYSSAPPTVKGPLYSVFGVAFTDGGWRGEAGGE